MTGRERLLDELRPACFAIAYVGASLLFAFGHSPSPMAEPEEATRQVSGDKGTQRVLLADLDDRGDDEIRRRFAGVGAPGT